jgi:putative transferase (TIGR04331 family)
MMAYAAQKIEEGCRLVYGQHGGYGIPKFMRAEEHERKISDRFLTWGWTDDLPNAWPVGLIKRSWIGIKRDSLPSRLLMIRGLWGRYTFRLDSGAGLNLNHAVDDCITFAKKLPTDIMRKDLLVRLYISDYGFGEEKIWRQECPDVEIAENEVRIESLLKTTKLAVYTYNVGTGWLEFMAADIPVIMFWDMHASPIRGNVERYFEKFMQVGIFHHTPDSAANHVSEIWCDIESWWNSPDVKSAKSSFLECYANTKLDVVSVIRKNILQTLSQ